MLEGIALLAPPLMALGVYNHLHRGRLSTRKLLFAYGTFTVIINICLYVISLYLLKADVVFSASYFVKYIAAAAVLAVVVPFMFNLFENSVSITVRRNDQSR